MSKWSLAGLLVAVATGMPFAMPSPSPVKPACCYFSALERDVKQPSQAAYLTWDPDEQIESFTVQPRFEGDAADFGMVVPTPSRPRLQEAPRDFFRALAVYTILKPVDREKFPALRLGRGGGPGSPAAGGFVGVRRGAAEKVRVLEAGVVGSLDYRILDTNDAQALFQWLGDNGYHYAGDETTLDFYIQKGWTFTVMRIDPSQMRKGAGGRYTGDVTPTRFTFESDALVYPLRITQLSVDQKTEALFYVDAPVKMDLPETFSYQPAYQSMWVGAYSMANWDLCDAAEKTWWEHAKESRGELRDMVSKQKKRRVALPTLEWARRLTSSDVDILTGLATFDREAPEEEVAKLKCLRGIVREGRFLTKLRCTFKKDEMTDDLLLRPATYAGKADSLEYVSALPTSPP